MLKVKLPFLLCCTLFVTSPQAQTIIDYIPNDTPDSRYTLHLDGTVTDTATGLVWQRCSLGQPFERIGDAKDDKTCTGEANKYTWSMASYQADRSRYAGYSDWRLPNVEELRSVVAYDRYSPAINTTVFPNTPSSTYWSSSPYAPNSVNTWIINFGYGNDGFGYGWGGDEYAVRLVRDGQ